VKKRLFEFLIPERTHLKAVIAALVAIFLLSGVLAYQVYRSEEARKGLEETNVQALEGNALTAYTTTFERWTFNAFRNVFYNAVDTAMRGGSYDDMTRAIDFAALCNNCPESAGIKDVWEVDLKGPNTNPHVSPAVLRQLKQNPTRQLVDGSWETGAFALNTGGRVEGYAFLLDVRGGRTHAWLIPLTPTFVRLLATGVLADSALIRSTFTNRIRADSIFRTEVHLGDASLAQTTDAPYASPERVSTRVLNGAMFPGMSWNVGVLPVARHLFVPRDTFWLSPVLLLGVMAMIASVIGMAIALVRREEELHRLRSDLISGVSHELRTPLAQIRMFAETLLLGRIRTEAERRRSLEVIDQEAKRLSHFVENMLQFAKGEAGRTKLAPEPTSFAIEVRRAVESFAPMCQARGVEVRTELEEGVTASVDRAALRRIMLNLMENALKYGPDEQRITVGIAIFNDTVRLWVDDEGEGIPRLERERVFDSFYRLSRELDRRITGSGIGLAVVRQLATLHGGRAWADEAPGGGARLVVEFPDAYVRPVDEGTGWAVA
jgi:signal transduction histidine kinase